MAYLYTDLDRPRGVTRPNVLFVSERYDISFKESETSVVDVP